MSQILVTGGAGYIGSHTCVELVKSGYDVVVVDNLSNSYKQVLDRVERITGKYLQFYQIDILDKEALDKVFKKHKIDAVIHFAGLKSVGESVEEPLDYYMNNIVGSITLCEVMNENNCKKLVFSSTAAIYGKPHALPILEDFPLSATNPYGRTKLMQEEIYRDLSVSDKEWNVILLRYFNVIGAHQSGIIGESPNGVPKNILPNIADVAAGKREYVQVCGDDYDTPDGTGVRDYIHVVDLAVGHVKALEKLSHNPGVAEYNLGTGKGYSVLELIENYEQACGIKIPYVITERRPGDIDSCYADASKAERELGWIAQFGIDKMCEDSWRWKSNNPNGYESECD